MEVKKNNHILQGFLDFSKILKNLKKSFLFAIKNDRKNIIALIFFSILIAVIPYIQNGLFGKLINLTISYKDGLNNLKEIITATLFLILTTALPNIIGNLNSFIDTNFRFNIVRNLNLYFFKKIASLDIATVESPEYQELMQKAQERGNMSIYQFITFSITNLSNLIGVIVSFVILGFIDRNLLVYAFLGAIPALYTQMRYGKDVFWIWDLNSNNRRRYFNTRSHFEGIISLVELKLYQLSKKFISEIKQLLDSFDDELKKAERGKLIWEFLSIAIFFIFLGAGIWRIINLAITGLLPIGTMLFAYTTYRGFKGTLADFFKRIGWVSEFSNYTEYWFKIDEIQPKIKDNEIGEIVDFSNKPPKIEFIGVSFRYSENNQNYAIKNLSFTINPGEKIAIVGLSGAGKTTLIKLLCRVYDPESGSILINGKNLKDINLLSWQKQLGVLFQDFVSYEFTVKEAIALGNPEKELNEQKVKEAAKMARADVFIERLPKKYDQLIWKGFEDGVDLSKGERQRMALARVLYRESPITILDEPTASVDALAEQEIFETLEQLPKNRTVILISHRFSTVKNADNILVIEHGKLIEEGNHKKLIQNKERYAELYKIQADSYK